MNFIKRLSFVLKNYLTDIVLVVGIAAISIGAFLTSIVTGFYITGTLLILFAVSLYILGGD